MAEEMNQEEHKELHIEHSRAESSAPENSAAS